MRGLIFRLLLLALLLAPCCAQTQPPAPPLPPVAAPDFTIVALPDPQMYSEFNPEIFKAQTDWIVKHAADQNIKLVAILGDLVNDGDSAAQYANADAAVSVLDQARIPYLVALGNHDYLHSQPATRQAPLFEKTFSLRRYAAYGYIGGASFPAGSARNYFATLSINNEPWLFLVLEYFPPPEVLPWAKAVLDAHPDHKIVVLTHAFTGSDSFRAGRCDFNGPLAENVDIALTADDLWDRLLSRYANLTLILNGHVNGAARRADPGLHGNLVNQILADYQDEIQGGGGFLRVLTFRTAEHKLVVRTYSPWYDEYKTDDANQFTVPLAPSALDLTHAGLRGHVRDTDCADLVGASVTVEASRTTPSREPTGAPATGSSARAEASAHSTLVLTATEGYFSLPDLPPGTYTVRANAPGYAPERLRVEVRPGYSATARPFLSATTREFTITTMSASQTVVTEGAPPLSRADASDRVGSARTSSSATYVISIARAGGFATPVRFSVDGLPDGASAAFTPATPTLARRATLTVKTSAETPPGTYSLRLIADSGDMRRTLPLTLIVATAKQ